MRARKIMTVAAVMAMIGSAFALSCEPVRVRVSDADFSFWRVLPEGDFDLHFDFPSGASSAELTISGGKRRTVVGDISASPVRVSADMIPVTNDEGENVVSFNLVFDTGDTLCAGGFGLVKGRGTHGARLRVRLGAESAPPWTDVGRYDVLPVSAGTERLVVDGTEIPWSGEQGWHLLGPVPPRSVVQVAMGDDDPVLLARRFGTGTQIVVR